MSPDAEQMKKLKQERPYRYNEIIKQAQFSLQRRRNVKVEKIDNAALPAGSPMTFYCKACNHVSDIKPEDYLFQAREYCGECSVLWELHELPAASSS